jgi:hypothetical protein
MIFTIYSAYNHKCATAAKCRESHQRRTDATSAVAFPDSGGVTHGILQRWRAYDCMHCRFAMGHTENFSSNSSSNILRLLVAAATCIPHRCLEIASYIHSAI